MSSEECQLININIEVCGVSVLGVLVKLFT